MRRARSGFPFGLISAWRLVSTLVATRWDSALNSPLNSARPWGRDYRGSGICSREMVDEAARAVERDGNARGTALRICRGWGPVSTTMTVPLVVPHAWPADEDSACVRPVDIKIPWGDGSLEGVRMAKTHPPCPPAFRAEAVELARTSGKVSLLAYELRVSEQALRGWMKRTDGDGERDGRRSLR